MPARFPLRTPLAALKSIARMPLFRREFARVFITDQRPWSDVPDPSCLPGDYN